MSAILIITFFLLAAIALQLYRRQHTTSLQRADRAFKVVKPRSLFGDTAFSETDAAGDRPRLKSSVADHNFSDQRQAYLARAAQGDLTVLDAISRAGDPALYRMLLYELVRRADTTDERTLALSAHIAQSGELRASVEAAEALLKVWRRTPDRATTALLLRIAALSDDASIFQKAVEATRQSLRAGQLPMTAGEWRALVESEYWVISSASRSTGAGFVLRRSIAALRREAAAARAQVADKRED